MATSVVQAAGLGWPSPLRVIPTCVSLFQEAAMLCLFIAHGLHCSSKGRKLRVSVGLTPTATFGPVSSPARKPGNPRAGLDPTSNNQLEGCTGKKVVTRCSPILWILWVGHIQPNCYWTGVRTLVGCGDEATGEESEKASWRRGAGHMSDRGHWEDSESSGRSGRRGGEREHGLMGAEAQVCVPRP